MRTTLMLDDDLIARAQTFTGTNEKTALGRQPLRALIERESFLGELALGNLARRC